MHQCTDHPDKTDLKKKKKNGADIGKLRQTFFLTKSTNFYASSILKEIVLFQSVLLLVTEDEKQNYDSTLQIWEALENCYQN